MLLTWDFWKWGTVYMATFKTLWTVSWLAKNYAFWKEDTMQLLVTEDAWSS